MYVLFSLQPNARGRSTDSNQVHYDHHGDPSDFPNSTFVVGPGATSVLAHGLGGKGSHQHFEHDLLSKHKVVELQSPPGSASREDQAAWKPIASVPHAYDIFNDGSAYILNCPGHLPGHINLLCRMSEKKWLCLTGDAFHDPRLLSGEKEIGTWTDANSGEQLCIHHDPEGARESIRRLRELQGAGGEGVEVECVGAHDEGWVARNRAAFFPGTVK